MSNAVLVSDHDIVDLHLRVTEADELVVSLVRRDGRYIEAAVPLPRLEDRGHGEYTG